MVSVNYKYFNANTGVSYLVVNLHETIFSVNNRHITSFKSLSSLKHLTISMKFIKLLCLLNYIHIEYSVKLPMLTKKSMLKLKHFTNINISWIL